MSESYESVVPGADYGTGGEVEDDLETGYHDDEYDEHYEHEERDDNDEEYDD
jgi:hypothetical protein